jgi:RNA polymerase sigma-70 factor (ECF subfamily)
LRVLREDGKKDDDLATWLADGYIPAYRTAFLILHNRADVEEAVQDAFLRAWRFRAAVPPGEGVKPWLYRVVVNACLSKLRVEQRHRDRTTELDLDQPPVSSGEAHDPEALVVASEAHRAVLEVLAQLPDALRVVVALRYYAQLTEKEIAGVIHRRPGTVKSRLHEARARLAADARLTALAGRFDDETAESGEA